MNEIFDLAQKEGRDFELITDFLLKFLEELTNVIKNIMFFDSQNNEFVFFNSFRSILRNSNKHFRKARRQRSIH